MSSVRQTFTKISPLMYSSSLRLNSASPWSLHIPPMLFSTLKSAFGLMNRILVRAVAEDERFAVRGQAPAFAGVEENWSRVLTSFQVINERDMIRPGKLIELPVQLRQALGEIGPAGTSTFCRTLPVSSSTLRSDDRPFRPVLS